MFGPIPLIVLGGAIVAVVLLDMVSTVVAVSAGAGRVTAVITNTLWWIGDRIARWAPARSARQALGPIVLFTVLLWWLVGLVVGWSLVMSADMVGPVGGGDLGDADVLEFAAAAVLGRGTPNLEPVHTPAIIVEQVAGFTGLLTVGLVVAYVLPVVSAVVESRRFAAYVASLGHTAEEILDRAWDGQAWGSLDLHLIALTPMVSLQAQRHLAYPMLLSFHSTRRSTSLAASMVVLDETVSLLDCATEDQRMHDTVIVPLRIALSEFIDSLDRAHITPGARSAPHPDARSLRDRGLPLCSQDELETAYEDLEQRRRLLHALMERTGWRWDDMRGVAPVADISVNRIGLRDRRS